MKLKQVVRLDGLYTILTKERVFWTSRDDKSWGNDKEIHGGTSGR